MWRTRVAGREGFREECADDYFLFLFKCENIHDLPTLVTATATSGDLSGFRWDKWPKFGRFETVSR